MYLHIFIYIYKETHFDTCRYIFVRVYRLRYIYPYPHFHLHTHTHTHPPARTLTYPKKKNPTHAQSFPRSRSHTPLPKY